MLLLLASGSIVAAGIVGVDPYQLYLCCGLSGGRSRWAGVCRTRRTRRPVKIEQRAFVFVCV